MGARWVLAGLLCAAPAVAADLRVLVDHSTEQPWALLQEDQLISGLHRDLGEALAQRLGRQASFVVLPRRRMSAALETGQGDLSCALLPAWLPGPFAWSQAFLPGADVVVSLRSARRPLKLADLAGVTIGTVSGFVYPELESGLGLAFVREDAPNASANLRKLNVGRMEHATVNQLFVDYQRRQGLLTAPLHPYLVLSSYKMQCALSRRSGVTIEQLDQAITGLIGDGTLDKLLAPYR